MNILAIALFLACLPGPEASAQVRLSTYAAGGAFVPPPGLMQPDKFSASLIFDAAAEKASSKDPAQRLAAVRFISQSLDPRAKGYLADALRDGEASVRATALTGLARIAAPDTADRIASLLAYDPDPEVRRLSAMAFFSFPPASAGPALTRALKDSSPEVAAAAAYVLGKLQYAQAEEPLVEMLRDGGPAARSRAREALVAILSKKAVPLLLEALRGPDKAERIAAIRALGKIGDKRGLEEISGKLRAGEDPMVRAEAALALSRNGDHSGFDTVYELAKSQDPAVSGPSLEAAVNIGDQRCLSLVEELYAREPGAVKRQNLSVLRQRLKDRLSPPAAVPGQ